MQPIEDKIRQDRTGPAGAHPRNGIRGKSHVVGERPATPPCTPQGPRVPAPPPTDGGGKAKCAANLARYYGGVLTSRVGQISQASHAPYPRPIESVIPCPARPARTPAACLLCCTIFIGAPPHRRSKGQRAARAAARRPTRDHQSPRTPCPVRLGAFLAAGREIEQRRQQESDGVEISVCRDELQARWGGGGVRGVVVRLLLRRRVGRRGGPVPGHRGPPPPVRAAAGAAEADELRQHLRHVRHDGAPPRQEGAVDVLPGQVAVLRVHVGGEEPGGPAEEGEAAQDEALQELRHARRGAQHQAGELLREPGGTHGRRERLQGGSPEYPCQRQLLPSVVARPYGRCSLLCFCFIFFSGSSVLSAGALGCG